MDETWIIYILNNNESINHNEFKNIIKCKLNNIDGINNRIKLYEILDTNEIVNEILILYNVNDFKWKIIKYKNINFNPGLDFIFKKLINKNVINNNNNNKYPMLLLYNKNNKLNYNHFMDKLNNENLQFYKIEKSEAIKLGKVFYLHLDNEYRWDVSLYNIKYQIKNILDAKIITNKGNLHNLIINNKLNNIIPETYVLNSSNLHLYPSNLHLYPSNLDFKKIWILRSYDDKAFSGKGVYVINNLDQYTKAINNLKNIDKLNPDKIMLTKYIENPYLINNKKIHIRFYLVIIKIYDNVLGYLFPEGEIATASKPYVIFDLDDKSIHDTHFKNNTENLYFPEDLSKNISKNLSKNISKNLSKDFSNSGFNDNNEVSFEDFLNSEFSDNKNDDKNNITDDPKDIINNIINNVCLKLFTILKHSYNEIKCFDNGNISYEILGVDVMITDDLKNIYILEINNKIGLDEPMNKLGYLDFAADIVKYLTNFYEYLNHEYNDKNLNSKNNRDLKLLNIFNSEIQLIRLKNIDDNMIKELIDISTNINNMKFIGLGEIWDKNKILKMIKWDSDLKADYIPQYCIKINFTIIGYISLRDYKENLSNNNSNIKEIRIFIDEKFRNKGYAKLAIYELLSLNSYDKIIFNALIKSDNIGSQKLFNNIGFKYINDITRNKTLLKIYQYRN